MPEATPAPPPAAPAEATPPQSPPKKTYTLKFEPGEDFTEVALYTKGVVRGKIWISPAVVVDMRSLSAKEVDEINSAVKITDGMTTNHYNTEITYQNLAHSIDKIGNEKLDPDIGKRIEKLKSMAAPVVTRLSLAYLEFNSRVDDLFVGKEALETAKKS